MHICFCVLSIVMRWKPVILWAAIAHDEFLDYVERTKTDDLDKAYFALEITIDVFIFALGIGVLYAI